MYLYFDRNKVLREIINDEAIVQGLNRNKIFIYYELQGDEPLTFNSGKFRKSDDTEVDILQDDITTISDLTSDSAKIPYNPNRDLKFFKYGKGYPFTVITVNNAVYSIDGVVLGTVNVTVTGYDPETLERFTFMVEETNGIEISEPLDFSMFEYLIKLFGNRSVFAVRGIPADVSIYNADDILVNLLDKKLYTITGNPKVASMWLELSDLATETDLLALTATVNNHIGNKNNPHEVTKAQLGLGNVDNTSDLDKPISTVTQQALDEKVDKTYVDTNFAHTLDLSIDSNYDLVVKLLNYNGTVISQDDVDLPLESIVVSATYYENYTYEGTTYNKVIVIVLATTDVPTIVPVGDLVNGLVSTDELATALASYYTKSQTDTLLNEKANSSDVYTQNQVNALLEGKANVDGNYPTMTVGVADELSPYHEESGDEQDTPFNFQATGTANGTQPDFSTGSFALLKEKQGYTIVKNQLVVNGNFESSSGWESQSSDNTSISIANNTATVTVTQIAAEPYAFYYGIRHPITNPIVGHYYLIHATCSSSKFTNFATDTFGGAGQFSNGFVLWQCSTSATGYIIIKPIITNITVAVNDIYTVKNVFVIDLTQMFNGNIPQDLLDHPENFFRYYQGDLSYNTGTVVHSNAQYLKCIGRNQWDEEWQVGSINLVSGTFYNSTTQIRSKNYIKVISNTQYCFHDDYTNHEFGIAWYDKDKNFISWNYTSRNNQHFTSPSNACYMAFTMYNGYGTTYRNDITVSLYYSGESGYDQYYPYEVLTDTDTCTELLISAGNAKDTKVNSGLITRRIGSVDLGTLDWEYKTETQLPYFQAIFHMKRLEDSTTVGNLLCSIYIATSPNKIGSSGYDKTIAGSSDAITKVYIQDSSYTDATTFKNAMNGVYLFYELATPTTEQGTPFSENLFIDDFGTMSFEGASGVPQGNLIFYPIDYKAYIDTLYNRSEGTPDNIFTKNSDFVKVAELSAQTSYAGGNVDIANVSSYSFFLICFNSNCADRPRGTTIVPNISGVPHEIYHNFQFNDGSNDVGVSACRRVTITGSGMTFGAGFVVSDTSGAVGASSMCMPLTIYGIKL